MLAASKVKISVSEEKNVNRNAYNTSSIKRVLEGFWKFLVVVVQNNGKEMYKKKCAARAKLFFC